MASSFASVASPRMRKAKFGPSGYCSLGEITVMKVDLLFYFPKPPAIRLLAHEGVDFASEESQFSSQA